jgi:nitroreductase
MSYGLVDFCNVSLTVPSAVMLNPQDPGPVAQIYIEHSSISDLVVDLGVGDPGKPIWSIRVWNEEPGTGNLNLTVDASGAAQYLPPSEEHRWFLRVFDAVNGNQGQIEKFTIISGNQTFDSTSIPVAIYDFQNSYSYIPGVPLELAMARRVSLRDFPYTENYTVPEVSSDQLLRVLWAGYGISSWGRTVSNVSGNYPLVIYVCNETAVYRYDPAQQVLELWRRGDYRGYDKNYFDYFLAPVELFITLNLSQYEFADTNLGALEAGAVVQNIYLEADALGLGTVCVGGINATLFHDVLDLPTDEVILYNMPLGHPIPSSFYNFTCAALPSSTYPGWELLPSVKQSSVFLDYALLETRTSHEWNETPLTSQEISQILWSAYGLSYLVDVRPYVNPTQHRTVPSAGGAYVFTMWMLNSTGTYLYDLWTQAVLKESSGDERGAIAQATGETWMASAPMILLPILNTSRMDYSNIDWAYTEAGCAFQDVFLESAAWGLVADSGKIVDENATKAALGITQYSDLKPTIAITVGHTMARLPGDVNGDGVVNILDAILLSSAFWSTPTSSTWNPYADLNNDGIVNILDAITLANNFGKTT